MSTEEDLGSRKPRFWDGGLVAKRVMDSRGAGVKMTAGRGWVCWLVSLFVFVCSC